MDRLSSSSLALTGQSEQHLSAEPAADAAADAVGARMHLAVLPDFLALRDAARAAGFDLAVHSAFRDFPRQLSIWNRKASGLLAVLDSNARPIDIRTLSERDLVFAILRWSALPGTSRHHWGTDLDVYDAATTPTGYDIQLIPAEVDPGGMHGPLHEWLDARMASGTAFGFFRPYDIDRGGVAPERWHLSHAPLASTFAQRLTPELLRPILTGADLHLKEVVLHELEHIFHRFVTNISQPPRLVAPATPNEPGA